MIGLFGFGVVYGEGEMNNNRSYVRGADVIAALVIGFFAGAAAMYAFNRTPAPIVGVRPVTQVITTGAEAPTMSPLMKRVPEPVAVKPSDEAQASPQIVSERPKSRPEKIKVSKLVNVNTATQAELEMLPDVGPSLAKAILSYRDAHGPFTKVDELDRVKGIGPKLLAKISPMVTVGSELP